MPHLLTVSAAVADVDAFCSGRIGVRTARDAARRRGYLLLENRFRVKTAEKAAEFRKNLYFCMIICKIKTQRYEYFV